MSKIKRFLLIVLGVFIVVIVFLLCSVLWLASAVFDNKATVAYIPHFPDFATLNQIVNKLSGSLNNDAVSADVLNPNTVIEAELTEKEINEIIASGIQFYINAGGGQAKSEQLKTLSIKFKDGAFHANYSRDSKMKTPFGSYINFYCQFIPEISNGSISINIKTFKIGKIPIPTKKINQKLHQEIKKGKTKNEVQLFLNAFKELKVDGNKIKIKYSPSAIFNSLLDFSKLTQ